MTHEEFDKLVQGVETGIGRNPGALYRRVLGLAAVGYAGLLLPLVLVLVVGAAFIIPGIFFPQDGVFLLIIIGAVVLALGGWATGRMFWVELKPLKGREVLREEAPALFATLGQLQHQLHSAPFDRVMIGPDCNAYCAPRPRLGVFGWNENHLILGLPLMEGLSPEELTAVIAHECAHLSREHHRSGHWVYRLRRSWQQVFESMERPRVAGQISLRPVIQKFVEWFWPRFNAHAFVLSRAQEYQADAVAAKLAGPANIATALIRIGWYGRVLDEKLWPDLWQLSHSNPTPPENVFLRIRESIAGINRDTEAKWLDRAFSTTTTNADTHPCLSDRLQAIGWNANSGGGSQRPALAPPQPNAADAFLETSLVKIREDVEKNWRTECEPEWRKKYAKANVLHDHIGQLEKEPALQSADVDALWDKARMLIQLQQKETVQPLLRQILQSNPQHVMANFNLGAYLLLADDPSGEGHLEKAIAENEELLPQAANAYHAYFRRTGQSDRIRELYARVDQHDKAMAASRSERGNVTAADTFIPHDLSETELAALLETLAAHTDIMSAHLGRKELKYFVKQKLYLLCVRIRPRWHRIPDADRESFLVKQLIKTTRLPGRVLILTPTGSFRAVARKLTRVPGTKILPRE